MITCCQLLVTKEQSYDVRVSLSQIEEQRAPNSPSECVFVPTKLSNNKPSPSPSYNYCSSAHSISNKNALGELVCHKLMTRYEASNTHNSEANLNPSVTSLRSASSTCIAPNGK